VKITPHERLIALVVPRGGEGILVVPALEAASARENPAGLAVLAWEDSEGPFNVVRDALRRSRVRRLAIEKDSVTVRVFEALQDALPGDPFADVTPIVTELRMRKSQAELALLERAAAILDECLTQVPALLRPGRSEAEIAFALDGLVRTNGAEGTPFDTIVLSGPNAALPHGRPGERELRAGDLVIVDVGAVHAGYCADVTRTFTIGEPDEQAQEIYGIVRAAQEAAREAVRPGGRCHDVDAAARSIIETAGFGQSFIHRTGHGVGLEVHEPPSLVAGEERVLEPGMVVTVEPGIYLPGVGGVRIEDDVAVGSDGPDVLTTASRALLAVSA
jgi:Xaa-Pro dipeptidase